MVRVSSLLVGVRSRPGALGLMRIDLHVRHATLDDTPVIAALLAELGYPTSAEHAARRLARLSDSEDVVLLAESADGPVGFASVHLIPLVHLDARLARITAFVVSERSHTLALAPRSWEPVRAGPRNAAPSARR